MRRPANLCAVLLSACSIIVWASCAGTSMAPGDGPGTTSDAGPSDAGGLQDDGGPLPGDGGSNDAGTGDAGLADAGPYDAGLGDAGREDAGPRDAGPSDAGPGDAGSDGGPLACTPNSECTSVSSGSLEYCAGTTCTDLGTCIARPEACAAPSAPVCGCDGVSYESACLAAMAGMRVGPDSACEPPDAGTPAADAGQCMTYSPLPCGAVESCRCANGSTQLAGCAGPPNCADACCAYGGYP